jgi:hypothetical protein
MANLTITAANVKPGGNAIIDYAHLAGAALTQGQPVYLDEATNTYKLSDANGAGAKSFDGVTLNAASSGQPIAVQTGGDLTAGATLTPGTTYCVSETAGLLCPQADLITGDDVIIAGVAKSTTVLGVHGNVTGVTL